MNIEKLVALANHLDEKGEYEEAAKIDAMIHEAQPEEEGLVEKLKEEGWQDPQVQTFGPGELGQSSDEDFKEKYLESMHKMLDEAGYSVFRPGELEEWLKELGYEKVEKPGEEVTDPSARLPVEEDTKPDIPLPKFEEDQAMDPEYTRLLGEKQGELNTLLDKFLESPDDNVIKKELMHELEQYAELYSEGNQTEEKLSSVKSMFSKLANLADRLDKLGAPEQADMIDNFINKHSNSVLPDVMEWKEPDPEGQYSKVYDTEYHHSLQVREPKTKQERVDLEGREKHHVENYRSVDDTNKKEAAHNLQTRYSPDLVGVQLARIGEGIYQCPVTGKIYNFETGYTDMDGEYHPGGSVAQQTPDSTGYGIPHRVFDTREQIVNRINT